MDTSDRRLKIRAHGGVEPLSAPEPIVAGFNVHRRQATVDALDKLMAELWRRHLESTPAPVEQWVARRPGREVPVAVEACRGWPSVCRTLEAPGAAAHLADAGETRALRGHKRRAKTARAREVAVRAALRVAVAEGGARLSTCASGALESGCATPCRPRARPERPG